MFLTRAHQRLLRTGLARLTDPVPNPPRSASRAYQTAVDDLTRESGLSSMGLDPILSASPTQAF